ncbi:hypothetical protein RTP6_005099 [Batrachochytrium dendrobatidis]
MYYKKGFIYWHAILTAVTFKRATILPTILPVILTTVLWSTLIVYLNRSEIWVLEFDDKLISMLGMALAFLLAFRTNRAFDRYWQGAQLWTTLSIQSRNLSRLIWNGVQTTSHEHLVEKHQMMRMVLAVAVATKCALRSGSQTAHGSSKQSSRVSKSESFTTVQHDGENVQELLDSSCKKTQKRIHEFAVDNEVLDLLPPGYFKVHTWRQSMVDLSSDVPFCKKETQLNMPVHLAKSRVIDHSTREQIATLNAQEKSIQTPKQTAVAMHTHDELSAKRVATWRLGLDAHEVLVESHIAPLESRHDNPFLNNCWSADSNEQSDPVNKTPKLRNRKQDQPKPPSSSSSRMTRSMTKLAQTSDDTVLQKSKYSPLTSTRIQHYKSPKANLIVSISPHATKNPKEIQTLQYSHSTHLVDAHLSTSGVSSAFSWTDGQFSDKPRGSTSLLATPNEKKGFTTSSPQFPMQRFPMYSQDGSLVINTPLDIIYRIAFYLRRRRRAHLVDLDDVPSMTQAITTMIDSVTKFEQILNVPMPKSYDVHMKQILILYFLALPFQLVKSLGWAVVFVTLVVSFAYFGADAIAAEIDGPFGTDENDLPLDYFCQKLKGDIEYIMEAPLFDESLSSE